MVEAAVSSPYGFSISVQVLPTDLLGTLPTDSAASDLCALASQCEKVSEIRAFPMHKPVP